ncbi:MAG TPA: SRPBCC domain-containing protein, partial [Candidatus Dormibacteraeota bacterium]
MTSGEGGSTQVLGSLRSAGGSGVVRIEERLDAGVEAVWSAISDPQRLAQWPGKMEGDLRPGGR